MLRILTKLCRLDFKPHRILSHNWDIIKIVSQIFHETGEQTSVREMYLKIVRIGLRLQKAGIQPGDVVSIISQIYPITTPLLAAILAIGAIVSFLDDSLVTYYSKLPFQYLAITEIVFQKVLPLLIRCFQLTVYQTEAG